MTSADPLDAVVVALRADAGVASEVADRVYNTELPRGETEQTMPRKAVVVSLSGGGLLGRAYQQYGDVRITVTCYGGEDNHKEAREVWLAVHAALKQLRRGVHYGCLLHWARQSGGPIPMRDPDTDWPYLVNSWQVFHSEIPINS